MFPPLTYFRINDWTGECGRWSWWGAGGGAGGGGVKGGEGGGGGGGGTPQLV